MVPLGLQIKRLIPASILVSWLLISTYSEALAQDEIDLGTGSSSQTCIIVNTMEEFVPPASCEGTIEIWTRIFGHPLEDVSANRCVFALSYLYDCSTSTLVPVIFLGDEGGQESPTEMIAACETPDLAPPCGGVVWNGNGLTWTSEGSESTCSRWAWGLYVSAPCPATASASPPIRPP